MDKLLYLLPVLACPIMMGTMMVFMMRGNRAAPAAAPARQQDPNTAEEMAILRAEIATLRAAAQPARETRDATP